MRKPNQTSQEKNFSNLNTNAVTENKTSWKTLKLFLTGKVKTKSKITFIEKKYKDSSTEPSEEIISDEEKVAEIFNFFVNIVPNLKIPNNHNCDMDFQKTDDPVLNAINKYRYHSSIVMINSKIEPESIFYIFLTPFSAKLNHKLVVEELEISSSVLFTHLRNNYMKANTERVIFCYWQ